MYLEYSYSNPTANVGGFGSGVYLYKLPSGYTIDTTIIQSLTPGAPATTMQNAYGTILGSSALDIFSPAAIPASCFCTSIYATTTTTLALFIPAFYQNATINALYIWHGSTYFPYNANYNRITFNCSFPIS